MVRAPGPPRHAVLGGYRGTLGRLIYSTITSADGFVNDAEGRIGWAEPDEELHRFVNELVRPVGTYLYGRRMYVTMAYWEPADHLTGPSPVAAEFARIWQGADKVVYSTTLNTASTARTRIEREFDPGSVRRLKDGSAADLTVGGADLAGQALRAGLVDECWLFVAPVLVGGGTPALPLGFGAPLDLVDERSFAAGTVYLRYRVVG